MTYREDLLAQASAITTADRNRSYGDPLANHQRIADIWSVILGIDITPAQAALCMAGLKIARLAHDQGHEDSYIDAAAYIAIAYELQARQPNH